MAEKQQITHLLQAGKLKDAEELCRDFLSKSGKADSESWLLMAAIQAGSGKLDQVIQCCLKAIDIDPQSPAAYFNLGVAQQSLGDTDAAVSSYLKALDHNPAHPGANANLGMIFRNQQKLEDAARHLDSATSAQPHNPDLLYLLGNTHYQLGNTSDAERSFRAALNLRPDDPRVNNDLGSLLFSRGQAREAATLFRTAIRNEPESFIIHYNLGMALWRLGNYSDALSHCWRALKLSPDNLSARQNFVQVTNSVARSLLTDDMWEEIHRSFFIPGVDGQLIASTATGHIRDNELFTSLAGFSESLEIREFTRKLLDNKYLPLLEDRIFLALLSRTTITDHTLESFLTLARRSFLYFLLDSDKPGAVPAHPGLARFLSALAIQCFLNEYAYYVAPDERNGLDKLREELHGRLSTGDMDINEALWRILILASYEPLTSLPSETLDKTREFSSLFKYTQEVITRQVEEPEEEHRLAQGITSITGVSDNISRAVQQQYEASPYPRWMSVTLHRPRSLPDVLGEAFPGATLPDYRNRRIEMLIAGCGTGKHPLQSATRFSNVHVTAIDLSRTSLSYAQRKAREHGIRNIDFYQADILQLENLDRTFQVIESIGVLHHMSNPARGLEILCSKLDSNGLFNIGLYSSCARRSITAARNYLRERGYLPDPDSIRNARREIARGDRHDFNMDVLRISDFYSLSECRDLLFHVQEHTYDLTEIEQLLESAGLRFIGFEFNDNSIIRRYRNLHPDDVACTNLANWNRFEQRYKDTFIGMYIFWCQKMR